MSPAAGGKPGLERFLALRARRRRGQFGQAHDATTAQGKTACTHTAWQDIVELWTGEVVTQDDLSLIAGYDAGPKLIEGEWRLVGFSSTHSLRVIRHFKLPYKIAVDLPIEGLLQASNKAPVVLAVRYKDYPFERGVPGGRNGFAQHNGANQSVGFDGAHALELGGYLPVYGKVPVSATPDKPTGYNAYVMEPNHGTPGRPGVDHDVITTAQLKTAYLAVKTVPGWDHTLAFIPTKELA